MTRPRNETIARKAFAELVLDYEWEGGDGLPPAVSCRVLVDGWYKAAFCAPTREAAIERFYNGDWKEA